MNLRLTFLASSIAVAAVAGCYTGSAVDTNRPIPTVETEPTEPADGGEPPPSSVGEMKGLPCDVAVLINTTCGKCHGADGPEVKIASWEDLTAPSEFDPSKTVAELAFARMKSKSRPMPPAGNLGKDEIAVLGEWIEAGMKKGTCEPPKPEPRPKKDAGPVEPPPVEVDAGSDAATPVPVCEPGSTEPGALMRPGQACLGCHDGSGRPRKFAAAGTVFSSLAMPSDCNGESGLTSGMKVILAGANGTIRVLPVNAAGNFALPEMTAPDGGAPAAEALSRPFKAIVVRGNQIREMKGTRDVADCNGCHTERGRNGAPGRVLAP